VLAGIVKAVAISPKALADSATERLKELGYRNVTVKYADGYFG
jgi:protein-L-isoaspartate O-methyltransferase